MALGLFSLVLNSDSFAACPPDQSAFSMVFPAKFILLSEDPNSNPPETVPATITTAILDELKQESPRIVFVGTEATFARLKKVVSVRAGMSLTDRKLSLYLAQPVRFQQDVFESFYQKQNKSILIRQFQGYAPVNKGPDLTQLPSILSTESISARIGEPMNQHGAWLTGVGGNVESTSFGLNLVGSGEFSRDNLRNFSTGIFPNGNTTLFDTSWLALGHVDEVLVEIRSQTESGKCKSTFAINSPKLGLRFGGNEDRSIAALNDRLQIKFDGYKAQLTAAAKGSCDVAFVDVPILYRKPQAQNERVVHATAYPSLTNGLLISQRYFVVETGNKEVETFFENSLKKLGIKVIWLRLRDHLYSHGLIDGYLHCLTNSIRTCN
ncbi:MAG: protein-arginine deiminase domain-containing protein [Oligoflexia bacterium]|nr:protein-arginine deiminase domain-containing protein [Oligoflexia bacterium]